jgi:hypothetical protein
MSQRKSLRIEVTEDEKAAIKTMAEKLGYKKNMSEYIRQMATRGFAVQYDIDDLQRLVWEINKIGVNINQIVKLCNEAKTIDNDILNEILNQHTLVYDLLDGILAKKDLIKVSKIG